jgi:hypothetical protein
MKPFWKLGGDNRLHCPCHAAAERKLGAAQARIDELMFEYCPNDMSPEQKKRWAKSQKPAS